jgi:hypothetical protein
MMSTDDHVDGLEAVMNSNEAEIEEQAEASSQEDVAKAIEPAEEPEPKAEEPKAEEPKAEEQSTVPHAALHSEREAHKGTKAALVQAQNAMQGMERAFTNVMDRVGQPAVPPPKEIPDVAVDPVGHLQERITAAEEQVKNLAGAQPSPEQQQQMQAQGHRTQRAQAESNAAASADATFWPKYNYAQQAVRHDLRLQGYDHEQVETIARSWEEGLMENAERAGRSFPDIITEYAAGRGFDRWAASLGGGNNGGQPDGGDKMKTLRAGAEAAQSLGGSGDVAQGSGKSGTLANLANLDGADFDREFESMKRKGRLG